MSDTASATAAAVASLWVSWLAIALLLAGTGATARHALHRVRSRAWHPPGAAPELAWLDFWVGLSLAGFFLQLWNFWRPIDSAALAVLVLAALPGLALRLREQSPYAAVRLALPAALLALAAPPLALYLLGPALDGDTGLYHMQSVVWARSFAAVPGIANLHDRLAFNSTFHLYAALCEALPFSGHSFRIVNAPILLVSLVQLAQRAARRVDNGWQRAGRVFALMMIGPLSVQTQVPQFYGLAPDFAVFALMTVIAALSFDLLEDAGSRSSDYGYTALPVLCAAAIALKLTAAVFAVAALAIGAEQAWRVRRSAVGALARGAGAAALMIATWSVRGIVLSGYPFFPLSYLGVPVDWRLPRPLAEDMNHWIRSWARRPEAHWADVLGNATWLRPWLQTQFAELTAPALVASVGLLLAGLGARQSTLSLHLAARVLAPAALASAAWFASAPDIRFGRGPIWITAAAVFACAWSAATSRAPRWRSGAAAAPLALAVYLFAGARPLPEFAPEPIPRKEIAHYPAADGTRISYGLRQPHCWDVQPPCTPYRRPSLELRRRGDLHSGFRLSRRRECINLHACRPDHGLIAPTDLGVDLPRSDWHPWEDVRKHRWMNSTGRLVLYADAPRRVSLRLGVDVVAPGTRRLVVSDADRELATWSLEAGRVQTTDLELRPGFNVVSLRVAGAPNRVIWEARDGQPAIAVSTIEIADR